jgi:hypothetical protein
MTVIARHGRFFRDVAISCFARNIIFIESGNSDQLTISLENWLIFKQSFRRENRQIQEKVYASNGLCQVAPDRMALLEAVTGETVDQYKTR